jgi:hypothetical protein
VRRGKVELRRGRRKRGREAVERRVSVGETPGELETEIGLAAGIEGRIEDLCGNLGDAEGFGDMSAARDLGGLHCSLRVGCFHHYSLYRDLDLHHDLDRRLVRPDLFHAGCSFAAGLDRRLPLEEVVGVV